MNVSINAESISPFTKNGRTSVSFSLNISKHAMQIKLPFQNNNNNKKKVLDQTAAIAYYSTCLARALLCKFLQLLNQRHHGGLCYRKARGTPDEQKMRIFDIFNVNKEGNRNYSI